MTSPRSRGSPPYPPEEPRGRKARRVEREKVPFIPTGVCAATRQIEGEGEKTKSGTCQGLSLTRSKTAKKCRGSKSAGRASPWTWLRRAWTRSTRTLYSPWSMTWVIEVGSSSSSERAGSASRSFALLPLPSSALAAGLAVTAAEGGEVTSSSRLPHVRQKLKSSGKLLPHWLHEIVIVTSGRADLSA